MNKNFRIWISILVIIFVLGGCGVKEENRSDNSDNSKSTQFKDTVVTKAPKDTYTFTAEVMDSEKGLLITPDKNSYEYKSSDKISVNTIDSSIKDATGKKITLKELKPGDIIQITYNGIILESYPAQIKVSAINVVEHNKLIDGYLAIIDDVYQEDPALNSDMETLAVDTTGWTNISKAEKEIILGELKKRYGVEIKEGTFDELAKEGLINKKKLYFPKGVLISMNISNYDKKKQVITFSIQKWKSGLGAIGWDDSIAKYKDSTWKITRKNAWIS